MFICTSIIEDVNEIKFRFFLFWIAGLINQQLFKYFMIKKDVSELDRLKAN